MVATTMGDAVVSSSIAGRCAPLSSCQIHLQHHRSWRYDYFLAYGSRFPGRFCSISRSSCPAKRGVSVGRRRLRFGAVGSRRGFGLDEERLGFVSGRSAGVGAQEGDKEHQELDKVEDKSSESWTSSVQRANVVSRIFMATFVWISLFFGISVANNEIGGGRPGRRK